MNYNNVIPEFDYAASHIIKPPDIKKEKDIKYTKIVLNSRDRNSEKYPNPNSYTLELDTDIDEVLSGEILLLDVPFSAYLINKNNDTIIINATTIKLEHGNYSKDELATEVTLSINRELMGIGIEVVYIKRQDKYKFVCTSSSSFTLSTSTYLAEILGFKENVEYESDANFELLAPYRCRFDVNKYIILTIDYMSINHSINPNIHKSTAIIYENELQINTKSLTTPIKKYFNPIIPRLTQIRIKMTDFYGNPYDFQNHDHRIDIMYESRKHSIKYMS